MKKGISLLLCLFLTLTTSSVAFAAGNNGTISTNKQALSVSNSYKTTLNIDGKLVTATHKDALGTISPNDVQPPWNLSYHTVTSNHFQQLVAASIAGFLAVKFGGSSGEYLAFAIGLTGGTIQEFTGDVYEDVYYYWQTSGDPQYPYYVKQFIIYYGNPGLTDYKGSTTRYYYSNLPY